MACNRVDEVQDAKIRKLWSQGFLIREIADNIGVAVSTVGRSLRRQKLKRLGVGPKQAKTSGNQFTIDGGYDRIGGWKREIVGKGRA